jgi:hypothetical protein
VIELIGIFLLAGTVTSVAVINAVHRPFEIRSEDPHDFDITALEAYNRLLTALSTGKIKNHVLQLKETVDPLYFIAALGYADEIGNSCEALVTFDVVEGYKSTTTIRWTCRFLKWCEKSTAQAVRNSLDQWIIDCLESQTESQANANVIPKELHNVDQEQTQEEINRQINGAALPAIFNQTNDQAKDQAKDKLKTSPAETVGGVTQKFQKKLRKPPPPISPSPQQFPIPLKEAYLRVNDRLQKAPPAKTIWTVKEQIEDAYIIAHLNFGDAGLKPGNEVSAVVNIDFSNPSNELTTITWSCVFKHWSDESGIRDVQQFITTWLVDTLSDPAAALAAGQSQGSEPVNPIEPAPPAPVVKTVRSNYPREFAYLKLMQRISSAPQKNTKWKLIECNQGNRIVARLTYTATHKPEAVCNVHSTLDFEGDASSGTVKCTFVVSPESDTQIAQNFVVDTLKWMELSLR